ncbi:cold-shock protein [Pedobacter frigidisoli]|uniref:Cold-shock protein n=1 Tax=Pedobacter frigidisoli TaxID=2530455 RepID=A0A4R0P6D7_9SPHI|nr:cold-shock protein [Pedobacter frigidisoli]TCD11038.1 cold-shock protein [Pedobacter frigidisoli]
MIRRGRIKSINIKTGIGFIVDDNDQNIDFTHEGFVDKPELGEKVNFKIVLTTEGLRAVEIIQVLKKAN